MREREREREIERISSASKPLKINQVNIPLFNYIYNQGKYTFIYCYKSCYKSFSIAMT